MRYLAVLLAVIAVMGFVSSAGAFTGCDLNWGIYAGQHRGDETNPYYLYAIPDEYVPTIDGDLSDDAWMPQEMAWTIEDVPRASEEIRNGQCAKDDFDVMIYGPAWVPATNSLYFGVHKVDDVLYAPEESLTACWKEDNQQWCTDPDGSGGEYRGKGVNSKQAQQNFYTPKQGGHIGLFGPEELWWEFEEPYCHFAQNLDEATGSYDMEVMIKLWDWLDTSPETSTEHTFAPGQLIGLTFLVADVDSEDEARGVAWHCADPWKDANTFPAWLVLPVEATQEKLAVEPSTWGGIKAMFK